jgi:hypothetical protein
MTTLSRRCISRPSRSGQAAGLLMSIKLLIGIGLTSIREHAGRLAADLVEQTASLGWTPYRPLGDRAASGHIVSLRHPTAVVDEVQAKLAREHRIITSSIPVRTMCPAAVGGGELCVGHKVRTHAGRSSSVRCVHVPSGAGTSNVFSSPQTNW